jgi:hypothetical protein
MMPIHYITLHFCVWHAIVEKTACVLFELYVKLQVVYYTNMKQNEIYSYLTIFSVQPASNVFYLNVDNI